MPSLGHRVFVNTFKIEQLVDPPHNYSILHWSYLI